MKADVKGKAVLNLRQMPKELVAKLKAAAALEGTSLREYVCSVLQEHVTELEKRGTLPRR